MMCASRANTTCTRDKITTYSYKHEIVGSKNGTLENVETYRINTSRLFLTCLTSLITCGISKPVKNYTKLGIKNNIALK